MPSAHTIFIGRKVGVISLSILLVGSPIAMCDDNETAGLEHKGSGARAS